MAATAIRREITRQRNCDQNHGYYQDVLAARVLALADAHKGAVAGREDALYVLRQALIDVAAAAELLAAELPAPTVCPERGERAFGAYKSV